MFDYIGKNSMKIKIFTIITTMSLFLSQNIYSKKNEVNMTKHKKHLIIGVYSLSGAYFAKKTCVLRTRKSFK